MRIKEESFNIQHTEERSKNKPYSSESSEGDVMNVSSTQHQNLVSSDNEDEDDIKPANSSRKLLIEKAKESASGLAQEETIVANIMSL